ncbi:MAG: RlpA-like double-psi beta-barrel-protein domain-containing protein-containing protein [Linnemannia elongata]|nr:MAG: RlpA-like double-psi beta-barrel-protein domain-containing protein-containing protein [Linnemannia elongata]
MKLTQLAILLMALVIALLTIVDAGKSKPKPKPKKKPNPTQTVRFGKKISGKSTWFNGHDLKGAACYGNLMGNSHVNAGDSWMIGAVHMKHYKGGDRTACFECAKITAGKRSIVVRIIDDCAGCAPNQIDLTASAFKKLAPLSQGVVKTTYEFVRCPSKGNLKWPKSPKPKSH